MASGHAASGTTWRLLKDKYSNISKEMVSCFIKLCTNCTTTKPTSGRPPSIKPIISETFNSRAQVDLIDMQTCHDGEFRYILQYQDHLTKFCHLRPLRYKSKYHFIIIFYYFQITRKSTWWLNLKSSCWITLAIIIKILSKAHFRF